MTIDQYGRRIDYYDTPRFLVERLFDDDEDWDYDSPAGDMRDRLYDSSVGLSHSWDAVQPERRAQYDGAAVPDQWQLTIASFNKIMEMWDQQDWPAVSIPYQPSEGLLAAMEEGWV